MQSILLMGQVAEYNLHIKPKADAEHHHYQIRSSLDEAIQYAIYGIRADGKRHSHQCCISIQALEAVRNRLLKRKSALLICRDFEELHEIVWECAVSGFAALCVYDTALRLGAYLGIRPKCVYLHRGTTKGAAMLGLDVSSEFIRMEKLPKELQSMQADDAENFLCYIYKYGLGVGSFTPRNKCFPIKTKRTC